MIEQISTKINCPGRIVLAFFCFLFNFLQDCWDDEISFKDEGVSLTATPGSSLEGCESSAVAPPESPPPYLEQSGPAPVVESRVVVCPPASPPSLKDATPLLSRHDVVTAVTHHDINGMTAVSTVALKDVDVQMTSLSGYETYV